MHIDWHDLAQPDQRGEYHRRDSLVRVTEDDLRIWREHPNATFELVIAQAYGGPKAYVLGMAEYEDPVRSR